MIAELYWCLKRGKKLKSKIYKIKKNIPTPNGINLVEQKWP